MLYNRFDPQYTTLQYELMKLLDSVSATTGTSSGAQMTQSAAANTITPITVRAAATIATMAPIIALYPFLQRYFVTGLTIGGVKE
jgi:putative aldouronate transport system permease protein